jgi:redox-sensitive bicupin YhaK (pirin superfamily)
MIQVYPKESRYSGDLGWLQANASFSFGETFDEENAAFGPMRVCNDDTVEARKGFGAHPHADMEIVSLILSGELRHEDNLGNVAVTGFGAVQRMSAGTGVVHTEANPSDTEPVNIIQMWFMPERRGLVPTYETSTFEPEAMNGTLLPIVSRAGGAHIASIHQDMTIYLSKLEQGQSLEFEQAEGRRVFLFCFEGDLAVANRRQPEESATIRERDTARLEGVAQLSLSAVTPSFYMLIDLP